MSDGTSTVTSSAGIPVGSITVGTGKVRVEHHGAVAEIVLDGKPLNLFDGLMLADATEAVATVAAGLATNGTRAVLLRAEGKVFCAGVDVHEFLDLTAEQGGALMGSYLALAHAVEDLPVPTLAVVHGLCLTIGLEVVLACDLLWAAQEASFGLVEATVGLTPGGGGTQRLAARAGAARAAEAVLTGAIYPAAEFERWGVANRVLPAAELLDAARGAAAALAAGPTVAAAAGKKLLRAQREGGVAAADAITGETTGVVFPTDDIRAGITSLLEHGPGKAVFTGR